MLRKIKLYGPLAKFIGKRVLQADIASAAEAVRFLVVNFPALEQHMADQHYRVSVGNYDLAEDELHNPTGQQEIRFIPVLSGAGGTTGQIIAGIALIALSFVSFGGAAGVFAGLGAKGAFGSALMFNLGAGLLFTGVARLLTPVPSIIPKDQDDPRKSYSFSGIQQTSRQGVPVPIVYGETLVGSVVISAGIDTVQI